MQLIQWVKQMKWALLISALFSQTACTAPAPEAQAMSPAVLSNPSAKTTQQISTAVSQLLNGKKVMLAANTFTKSNQLIVERYAKNPATMPGLNGRLMDAPVIHRFLLMQKAENCYVVYEKTGKQFLLNGVRCKKLP